MCFKKSANVQICWSESSFFHAGIPVQRMPCFIFQNVSPSGSSSTPSVANCGGLGFLPLAIGDADVSPPAVPWQIAQFVPPLVKKPWTGSSGRVECDAGRPTCPTRSINPYHRLNNRCLMMANQSSDVDQADDAMKALQNERLKRVG